MQKTVCFALGAPVEVDGQKELVAVYNLTEQNLREALQLGGMPSPSIAVVKAREGHTKYGPVSLVFGSDTIDPMVDKANRVYGADAWTPTRPGVEYEVHADKARALNTTLAQLSRQTAGGEFARGNVITGTMDMEVSRKSPQQIAEELAHSDAVKAAYLAAQGEDVDVVTKQEQRFTEEQKARSERIIEAVGGEDVLRDIVETDAKNGNYDKANAVLQAVKEAEEVNRLIPPKLYRWLKRAYEYLDAGNEPAKMVKDTDAMRQALQQKAPDAKVEQWLLPQVEKTLGRKGIYNGKEIYTRNGNRRSFAQLHNPYTLENLVNAMNQEQARGKGAWGLSARTLLSTAGNFLFGSELYSAVDNAMSGKDYDVVSATNISAVNDLMSDVTKWFAEWRRDTSGMTEAQLAAHEDRLHTRTFNLIEDGMEIAGVPYGNGRKLVDAVQGYWDDIQTAARGGKFSFNALREEGDPDCAV